MSTISLGKVEYLDTNRVLHLNPNHMVYGSRWHAYHAIQTTHKVC